MLSLGCSREQCMTCSVIPNCCRWFCWYLCVVYVCVYCIYMGESVDATGVFLCIHTYTFVHSHINITWMCSACVINSTTARLFVRFECDRRERGRREEGLLLVYVRTPCIYNVHMCIVYISRLEVTLPTTSNLEVCFFMFGSFQRCGTFFVSTTRRDIHFTYICVRVYIRIKRTKIGFCCCCL